ncbi:hypothetical protein BJ878DRAFT_477658 [Calycina marina]|uniref:Uncharacterized protein n=1 Tax=Calycina marina TaxID=1763456 RepID=A0A9P7Z7N0_9HELO|nr:hypothetical protein BJ878DRAFT_477658 [Calycina marina]
MSIDASPDPNHQTNQHSLSNRHPSTITSSSKMSKFSLAVHSYTPPTLPPQPSDIQAATSDFKSPMLSSRSVAAATSPLLFIIALSAARPTDPLYPATHLQITYRFEGTGEIFVPNLITSKNLVEVSGETSSRDAVESSNEAVEEREGEGEDAKKLYRVEIPPADILRAKVNEGTTNDADVSVYAWRREKLLGKYAIGRIEGLGIVGLKAEPIHLLRQKNWAEKPRGS